MNESHNVCSDVCKFIFTVEIHESGMLCDKQA
jgi:hypothetical protein